MKVPETPGEIEEALATLDWERCEVQLEVIEKTWFGLFHKDFLTLEKWVARQLIILMGSTTSTSWESSQWGSLPIIAERPFTVDTRLGEDYKGKMAQAFEDLLGELFEKGWELSEDVTPYTTPIYLQHPPTKRR